MRSVIARVRAAVLLALLLLTAPQISRSLTESRVPLGVLHLPYVCTERSTFRTLPSLYFTTVAFSTSPHNYSDSDNLYLQFDTGSSDVWAITDECLEGIPSSSSSTCSPFTVEKSGPAASCCPSNDCNALTKGFYSHVQNVQNANKPCVTFPITNSEVCQLDKYGIGCTYGKTAESYTYLVDPTPSPSPMAGFSIKRKVGLVDIAVEMQETISVGIAGMAFGSLAAYTSPVLASDFSFFVLQLRSDRFGPSYLYLNEGKSAEEILANNGRYLHGIPTNASLRLYMSNVAFFNNNYAYWLLPMTKFQMGATNLCPTSRSCSAVVDSGTSLWTVPAKLWADFIELTLGNKCSGQYKWDGMMLCPDTVASDFPTIELQIGSIATTFTPEQYMACGTLGKNSGFECPGTTTGGTACLLQAQKIGNMDARVMSARKQRRYQSMMGGAQNAQNSQYDYLFILGDTFLIDRYVIFDYDNHQVGMLCKETDGCTNDIPCDWLCQFVRRYWPYLAIFGSAFVVLAITFTVVGVVLRDRCCQCCVPWCTACGRLCRCCTAVLCRCTTTRTQSGREPLLQHKDRFTEYSRNSLN